MRALALLSVFLFAAPVAAAQAEGIQFTDAALDAMPPAANAYADITSGEARLDGDALVLTMGLSALPEMTPGLAYLFLFSDGEEEWYAGAITVPTLAWMKGTWGSDDSGPTSGDETTGTYVTGPGGSITVEFSVATLPPNVTTISAPRILIVDIKGGAPPGGALPPAIPLDEAQGEGGMQVRAASALPPADAAAPPSAPVEEGAASPAPAGSPTPSPTRETPGAPMLLALVGAALGLALGRRRA